MNNITILENTNAVDYVLSNDDGVLLHVCNAQGKMNSGIAKEIRERIPSAYTNYMDKHILGEYTYSDCCKVINLVAQQYYGYDGKRYLNYGALANCLVAVARSPFIAKDDNIVIPYKMGSDRAGGDWNIVLEIVQFIFKDYEIKVCKL